ncbi:grpE protein homolog 2, mitochondrial [Ambystoma mexicanum]|uniref:grpE protein homolog 2, mitochondrial n=1 Tax=Ambystoma mexicanum TaxID=8296 RepID=UPI0037E86F3B
MNMAAAGLVRGLSAAWGQVCCTALGVRGPVRELSASATHSLYGEKLLDHSKSTRGQTFCRWQHVGMPNTRHPDGQSKCNSNRVGDQAQSKCATCIHHHKDPKEEERDLANQALSLLQSLEDPASCGQVEMPAESSATVPAAGHSAPESTAGGCKMVAPSDDEDHMYAIQALERKTMSLERQLREAMVRHDTAVAEAENLRRRTQQIVVDAKQFGITTFCRDLVGLADSLATMAMELAKPESAGLHSKEIATSVANLEVHLQDIFQKHGLSKIYPLGRQYTPYEHEVESHVPTEGLAPGTVVAVSRTGYRLHGRTIRYALVQVAMEARTTPV